MRLRTLLGILTLYLGIVFIVDSLFIENLSLNFWFVSDLVAGFLFLLAGTAFIIGDGEIPEDNKSIFPRRWVWYLVTAGLAITALWHTMELLDLAVL